MQVPKTGVEGQRTKLNIEPLIKFWPLMYSIVQEFWNIIEPSIEDAALRNSLPIELYLYSELGLDRFSIEDFQRRDPYSNPEQFERVFVRLNIKGWIAPMADGSFQVTIEAREAARSLIQSGDVQLSGFDAMSGQDLKQLLALLKQIVMECCVAPEPPGKWAILKRFRVADEHYPPVMQIREYLMDLLAYRDDSHLSASRPQFNEAGIIWIVLGGLWTGNMVNAEQMAEKMAFRGYDVADYEIAIQAALELEWAEQAERPDAFRLTELGGQLREQAEQLTNEYFYAPWSILTQAEMNDLYELLIKLRDALKNYKKSL